jgi:dipeptidyl aminopeptidase/acylaminoacyl peptidase
MNAKKTFYAAIIATFLLGLYLPRTSAITREDYREADRLRRKFRGLVYKESIDPNWIGDEPKFWYRNELRDDTKEFILVDAEKGIKQKAFDHARLAKAITEQTGTEYTAEKLPFYSIKFVDDANAMEFQVGDTIWKINLSSYELGKIKTGVPEERRPERRGRWRGRRGEFGGQGQRPDPNEGIKSPDEQWEAFVKDYDLYMRSTLTDEIYRLTNDGNPDYNYSHRVLWSPDSKKLITNIVKPKPKWIVHYVQSSPPDQVQPKYEQMEYEKPGDAITISKPCLFHIDGKKQIKIDDKFFPNPFYQTEDWHWTPDSKSFYFYYNQRGHQLVRVIKVDAETGQTTVIIDEPSDTFVDYAHKKYLEYLDDTNEIIWATERDGWNHLYLYDMQTGDVKNQITKGDWLWRRVEQLDDENRQIWFSASGYYDSQDPYFMHYFRINFDGTGLVELTEGNGTHSIRYSPDRKYYVDTYSRVDMPPIHELRKSCDGSLIMELEKADANDLFAAGFQTPEPFVAMSRDDRFEIWGVIYRPASFDPNKSYPVIEDIYAGPQGSFVPKRWSDFYGQMSLAELGFIIVQIDGMGTSNRCRDFHHFCWHNLGDAGLPDRIKWMKKAAEKYPFMDISRVGVYGTSAGAQSATGAVLFHPEFYKVAVSSCGCHDNRVDKLWWNELWMGYPVGPHYEEQSNVTNADKLQGKLMLIVGEMDKNVDPSSTMQVVNALIKANKEFELIVVPGMGHSNGGRFGERKRRDFFVRHLLGEQTPDWNIEPEEEQQAEENED